MSTTPSITDTLQARGLVHQSTDLDGLREHLDEASRTIYLPTARSRAVFAVPADLPSRAGTGNSR